MKIKLAIGVAVFSLIASSLAAQTILDCEEGIQEGIQLVGDIIADPVVASTTDPAVLANAVGDLDAAVAECDGTEAGRVAALGILAGAAAALGYPLP